MVSTCSWSMQSGALICNSCKGTACLRLGKYREFSSAAWVRILKAFHEEMTNISLFPLCHKVQRSSWLRKQNAQKWILQVMLWTQKNTESQNGLVLRWLKDPVIPTPLEWAGTHFTRPDCSDTHPVLPWTPAGMGSPQCLWAISLAK